MRTIFKFNCSVCGAHPNEREFNNFIWPPSDKSLDTYLTILYSITQNIDKLNWINRKEFSLSLDRLKEELQQWNRNIELNIFDGNKTVFNLECPLCGTQAGPRPYDPYFRAWFAWYSLCRVQVSNVLFEAWKLLDRIDTLKSVADKFRMTKSNLGLQECSCGRPTTMLYEGKLCRWCHDSSQRENVLEMTLDATNGKLEITSEMGYMDSNPITKTQRDDETFVEYLDENSFAKYLCITKSEWEIIKKNLTSGQKQDGSIFWPLEVLFVGYPTGKWVEPLRKVFTEAKSWPATWEDCILQTMEEPSVPGEYEIAFRKYTELPREVREIFPFRNQILSNTIRKELEIKGLIEFGSKWDIDGYLDVQPIHILREISGRLGTGKGRSKREIVQKIINGASRDKIVSEIPELEVGWIKRIRSPMDILPEDWREYQRMKAQVFRAFIYGKYNSWLKLKTGCKCRIDCGLNCPTLCKVQGKGFQWNPKLTLNDVPPWFPGCQCGLMQDM